MPGASAKQKRTPAARPDDGRYAKRNTVPQGLIDSAGTKFFDGQLSTYNLRPGNTKRFRTALGKAMAGTGLCHVVCAGESTTAGRGLTNTELAYPAYLRKAMAAAGVPLAGNGAAFYTRGESAVVDAYTTVTGTWTQTAQQLYTTSSTAGSTMTTQVQGTAVDIISSNFGASSFTYAIDGGSTTTVTSANGNSLRRTTITGLSNAAHTIVITVVSGNVIMYSVEGYVSTGLRVTNAGSSGSKVNVWDASQFFSCAGAVVFQAPQLVLFGLTINDLNASTTRAAFKTAMLATINGFLTTSDVMIVTSNAATGSWTATQWADYQSVLYEIAEQLDIPLIDVYFRFPSYTENSAAGLMIDTYHPNANYYAERGRHHARVLLGV